MVREMYQPLDGSIRPAAFVANTSLPRHFVALSDPSAVVGVILATGDTWSSAGGLPRSLTITDNGDGTFSAVGTGVTDNGNGTFTATDTGITDNGDGTYTATG